MKGLEYSRLERITKNAKPYRGSTTRFPLGGRREIRKCFYVREENGQTVFDITYGYRWIRHQLTKEEYEARKALGDPSIHHYQYPGEPESYGWHESTPRRMGTVRPDNTFEFNCDTYDQGDRMFLSAYTYGWFVNDSRRGGLVYKARGQCTTIPIWRGMRVNCETMLPTEDYKVVVKQVDRKVAKHLTSGLRDFITTAETMLSAMDWGSFIDMVKEVHTQYKPETGETNDWGAYKKYTAIADRIKHSAPLDAAVLYMLAMDVSNLRWDMVHSRNNAISRSDEEPAAMFASVVRGIRKLIYKANQGVFSRVEYGYMTRYPTSDWGVDVIVDGVSHAQYGYAA